MFPGDLLPSLKCLNLFHQQRQLQKFINPPQPCRKPGWTMGHASQQQFSKNLPTPLWHSIQSCLVNRDHLVYYTYINPYIGIIDNGFL